MKLNLYHSPEGAQPYYSDIKNVNDFNIKLATFQLTTHILRFVWFKASLSAYFHQNEIKSKLKSQSLLNNLHYQLLSLSNKYIFDAAWKMPSFSARHEQMNFYWNKKNNNIKTV